MEEHLIQRIHPDVSRLWAVSDADGLFRGEEVTRLLGQKKVQVVVFDDPLAFRYLYEHEIRPKIELAENPGSFLILMEPDHDEFFRLPVDIFEACERFTVTIGDLFPSLSRNVLRELEPSVLSRIWNKRDMLPSASLGERDSADIVLRLGYKIEVAAIESITDLVVQLLPLHAEGQRLTERLAARLEEVASLKFSKYGIVKNIALNASAFWNFLGKEWRSWIQGSSDEVHEAHQLEVRFTDIHLRAWIDNVFEEGFLKRITLPSGTGRLPATWCHVGVSKNSTGNDDVDLVNQRKKLLDALPQKNASYQEWFKFAQRYSTHVSICFSQQSKLEVMEEFWTDLWPQVDDRFSGWVQDKFDSHHNLPPTRPVVVHQIPKLLERTHRTGRKVALLVLDGLSLSQWKVLRNRLEPRLAGISIQEDACLTHIPTITNVCRQAIYAGELPVFFEATIERTDCDVRRWKAFWNSTHGNRARPSLIRVDGHDKDLAIVRQEIEREPTALGITVKMPDETMHGATLGWRGMFASLALWADGGFLSGLIQECLAADYDVWLTSDHGNIEAIGEGSPKEGVMVDRSGQRVRTYPNETLRTRAAETMADRSISWNSLAIGQSYLPLFHTGRGAFVTPGQVLVCHGGISLDEVVVPLIHISKSTSI